MPVIAISGIPMKFSLSTAQKVLEKSVKTKFTALKFRETQPGHTFKVMYIRVYADPAEVIRNIQNSTFGRIRLSAFLSKTPPKFKETNQKKPIKGMNEKPEKVIVLVHDGIMKELQSKYTGLFVLSKKTGHKLLHVIASTISDRLKALVTGNKEAAANATKLSSAYRKMHPHFCDFQLILSTLHAIQDAAAIQRTHLVEAQLMEDNYLPPAVENTSLKDIRACCEKYSERIIKKVTEHLKSLVKTETAGETLSEEEQARMRVRQELLKMTPFLPAITKQVVNNHLLPKTPFYQIRMRVYGEPYLPNKEVLMKVFQRNKVFGTIRSSYMYNLLTFCVNQREYDVIKALDSTEVGGAKLIIRFSDVPFFKVPYDVMKDLTSVYGVLPSEIDMRQNEDEQIEEIHDAATISDN